MILFLTELWHLLDVSAVAGHGAVLAVLAVLLLNMQYERDVHTCTRLDEQLVCDAITPQSLYTNV